MLNVVVMDLDNHVLDLIPCENGIDEALDVIADRITLPEEDPRASFDVCAGIWRIAVEAADLDDDPERGAATRFVVGRRGHAHRYGLALVTPAHVYESHRMVTS